MEIHVGFWWKTWRKEQFGRPRCIWEDNITIDVKEIEWDSTDCIHEAQDREVADPCKHNSEIIGSSKFGKFLD